MRVVVAVEASEKIEPLRQLLLGMGLQNEPADCVPYADLPVRLAKGGADLVLVQVGSDPSRVTGIIRQAVSLTKAPVLAAGKTTHDHRTELEIVKSGASEFLDQDRLHGALEAALIKMRTSGLVEYGGCQVLAVTSATAGTGVTTVATNLAFVWANRYKDKVALVELSRDAAAVALSLDLDPRFTVADIGTNWQRMDAAFLRQSMTTHPGGVQVLAHKPETLEVPAMDPQAVRKAVLLLRSMYTAAVLDVGHHLGEEHYEAMRLCDLVAVVVRLDVPALRQTRRFLRMLEEHKIPRDRVRLIVNRYGQRGQLGWKQAQEAVGGEFTDYIPDDAARFNRALNKGQPVVRASSLAGVSRRFARIAQKLNGQPAR